MCVSVKVVFSLFIRSHPSRIIMINFLYLNLRLYFDTSRKAAAVIVFVLLSFHRE